MAIEAQGLAIAGLLISPTVIGNDAVVVHSAGHPGKGATPVQSAVNADDGGLRLVRSSFPDGEMGNPRQRKGREAKGGGFSGSYG